MASGLSAAWCVVAHGGPSSVGVDSGVCARAGRAELLKLLRTHDVDVYQRIGTRMKKTKHMLVDDVCKLIQ